MVVMAAMTTFWFSNSSWGVLMMGAIAMFLKRGGEGLKLVVFELSQLNTFSKRVSVGAYHFPIW